MIEREGILNLDQLSRYLNVPKSTLYTLVRSRRIPGHKVGRHWRFRREVIDQWLDQPQQAESIPEAQLK